MASQTPWTIVFYTDARGHAPAWDFLRSLSGGEVSVALRQLNLLAAYGVDLGMPHVRPVGDLWELRAGPNRFFYVACTGRVLLVLHGYRKQSQKAPRGEVSTAERRLRDYRDRGG